MRWPACRALPSTGTVRSVLKPASASAAVRARKYSCSSTACRSRERRYRTCSSKACRFRGIDRVEVVEGGGSTLYGSGLDRRRDQYHQHAAENQRGGSFDGVVRRAIVPVPNAVRFVSAHVCDQRFRTSRRNDAAERQRRTDGRTRRVRTHLRHAQPFVLRRSEPARPSYARGRSTSPRRRAFRRRTRTICGCVPKTGGRIPR